MCSSQFRRDCQAYEVILCKPKSPQGLSTFIVVKVIGYSLSQPKSINFLKITFALFLLLLNYFWILLFGSPSYISHIWLNIYCDCRVATIELLWKWRRKKESNRLARCLPKSYESKPSRSLLPAELFCVNVASTSVQVTFWCLKKRGTESMYGSTWGGGLVQSSVMA